MHFYRHLCAALVITLFCTLLPVGSFTAALAAEPDNTFATATEIVCGEGITGNITTLTDVDFYKVHLLSGTSVVFALTLSSGMDQRMDIYKPDETLLASYWSYNANCPSKVGFLTMPVSGDYYIKIYGFPNMGVYYLSCLVGNSSTSNNNTNYSATGAVSYAVQYALTPNNPPYVPFQNDCVSFVSQALNEGGGMAEISGQSPDIKNWYFNYAGNYHITWSKTDYFLKHWTKVRSSSYNGRAYKVNIYPVFFYV